MKLSRLMAPKILRSGEGECLETPEEVRRTILDGGDSAGQLALWRSTFHPGAGELLHVHNREDEWFLVEEGQFALEIGGITTILEIGDFVFAPRFTPHSYRCCGEGEGAITTGIYTAGFENYFRTLARHFMQGKPLPEHEKCHLLRAYEVQFGQFDATSPAESFPQILRLQEGERFEAFDSRGRTLISALSVQGRFSLDEWTTSPLGGPPLHVHEHENEGVPDPKWKVRVPNQQRPHSCAARRCYRCAAINTARISLWYRVRPAVPSSLASQANNQINTR